MKITIAAIGQKLPAWANAACDDYLERFPADWKVEVRALKPEDRASKPIPKVMAAEAARLKAAIPKDAITVIMDERGRQLTSVAFAEQFKNWMRDGRPVAFVIGGADGLDPEFKRSGTMQLRLSDMTLPHALARVVLLEQIYRAWSLLHNHPYHRV